MFEGRNGRDEGRHENGGSDTNVVLYIVRQSVFPLVSGSVMHSMHAFTCLYTYSCNQLQP